VLTGGLPVLFVSCSFFEAIEADLFEGFAGDGLISGSV
jgi:hypothetical protein